METAARREGSILILSVRGRVIGEAAVRLRQTVEAYLQQDAWEGLVLNLRQVEFLDSAGLGALVALHQRIAEQGPGWALTEVPAYLLRLFQVTKLDRLLPIEPDDATALARLRNRTQPQVAP